MSESSSAPMKIMLLMLTCGLLMAAWSADAGNLPDKEGHQVTDRTYPSGSAIAVLFQSPADAKRCEHSSRSSKAKRPATARLDADDSGGIVPAAYLEPPVAAPEPVEIAASVEIPVSLIHQRPVAAPVPVCVNESRPAGIVFTIASRIRADYRMSCWSCRQSWSTSSRRMAAVCRQTRHSLAEFGQVLSRNVLRIDWKARLSSGLNDNAGQRN